MILPLYEIRPFIPIERIKASRYRIHMAMAAVEWMNIRLKKTVAIRRAITENGYSPVGWLCLTRKDNRCKSADSVCPNKSFPFPTSFFASKFVAVLIVAISPPHGWTIILRNDLPEEGINWLSNSQNNSKRAYETVPASYVHALKLTLIAAIAATIP